MVPAELVSSSLLHCLTPPSQTASEYVLDVSVNGADFTIDAAHFAYEAAPVVTAMLPSQVAAAGGEVVTVLGANFRASPLLQAWFGGVPARLRFVSSDSATCVTPRIASVGNVSVTVSTNGDEVSATAAVLEILPGGTRLRHLAPSFGSAAGGYHVTVLGAGFVGSVLNVRFGDSTVECDVLTAGSVECFLLEHSQPGTVSVHSDGAEGRLSFMFLSAVIVSAVAPSTGPVAGNSFLAVTGSGFGVVHTPACNFGELSIAASVQSSTLIRCYSPPHSPGSVQVTIPSISTTFGEAVSSVQFLFTDLVLERITPVSALAGRAGEITVHGRHFTQDHVPSCRIGSHITSGVLLSPSEIVCGAPALESGNFTVDVSVNGVDFAPEPTELVYAVSDAGVVTAVSPDFGQMTGETTVEIASSRLEKDVYSCHFGAAHVVASWHSPALLSCQAPLAQATGNVVLRVSRKDHGFMRGNLSFTYTEDYVVTRLRPSMGPAAQGSILETNGGSFENRSSLTCLFSDAMHPARDVIASPAIFVAQHHVRCVTPEVPEITAIGTLQVRVSGHGREFPRSYSTYALQPKAIAMLLTPSSFDSGSMSVVTITGRGFAKSDSLACTFGRPRARDSLTADAVWLSPTQMLCYVPSFVPGRFAVEVSNNGVDFSSDGLAVDVSLPVEVHTLAPSSGWVGRSRSVTVTGTRFPDGVPAECVFGLSRAPARFVTSTAAVCFSPPLQHGLHAFELGVARSHVRVRPSTLTFASQHEPTVRRVVPTSGFVTGGTPVTIYGNEALDAISACRFGPETSPAEHVSASEIVCMSPPSVSVRSVELLVEDGHEGGALAAGTNFVYLGTWNVTAVAPTEASVHGGDRLTVHGTGFAQAGLNDLAVSFGLRRLAPATLVDSTVLEVLLPPLPAGLTRLDVSPNRVDFVPTLLSVRMSIPFIVRSISPSVGPPEGGTAVSVFGSDFRDGEEYACVFGEHRANASFKSDDLLTCTTPNVGHPFEAGVRVEGSRVGIANPVVFHFRAGPLVITAIPSVGATGGGGSITLTGSGFDAPGRYEVHFGDATARGAPLSSTLLRCVAPPHATGEVALRIALDGVAFAPDAPRFLFSAPPEVHFFRPSRGSAAGGYELVVAGAHFSRADPVKAVLGGELLVSATVLSSTAIALLAPPLAPGNWTVEVRTPGHGESAHGQVFHVVPAAHVEDAWPMSGPSAGGTVVLLRTHHTGVLFLKCMFGAAPAEVRTVNETHVSCVAPPAAEEGEVALALYSQDSRLPDVEVGAFLYYRECVVARVRPQAMQGPLHARTHSTLTVVGENFGPAHFARVGATALLGSGTEVVSSTLMRVTVPALAAGDAEITCSANGMDFASTGVYIAVSAPAIVLSIRPSRGRPEGGTAVTVFGETFSADVLLTCLFGSVAREASWLREGATVCVAPPHAPGNVSLAVQAPGQGDLGRPVTFTFDPLEHAAVASATEASSAGGAVVTVTSDAFRAEPSACRFGDATVSAAFASASTLVCVSPPQAPAIVALVVVNGGCEIPVVDFFRVAHEARVLHAAPSSGPARGGNVRGATRVGVSTGGGLHMPLRDRDGGRRARGAGPLAERLRARVRFAASRARQCAALRAAAGRGRGALRARLHVHQRNHRARGAVARRCGHVDAGRRARRALRALARAALPLRAHRRARAVERRG